MDWQILALTLTKCVIDNAADFTALLYDKSGKYKTEVAGIEALNQIRFEIATKRETSLSMLPTSAPTFLQYVKRAAWQSRIWMHSHIAEPNFQDSPSGNGWKMTDDRHL